MWPAALWQENVCQLEKAVVGRGLRQTLFAQHRLMLLQKKQKNSFSNYRGKRKLCFPPIIFFFHHHNGVWGHALDQSGPPWPPPNTPKKPIFSKKRKILQNIFGKGEFFQRVNYSPINCGHFATSRDPVSFSI